MSFRRKQGKSSSQRSSKIKREEIEDSSTTVIVSQASTATIAGEIVNINPNLPSRQYQCTLTTVPMHLLSNLLSRQYQCTCYQTYPHDSTNALAIKLNRLKGKSARYTSQKDFLSSSLTTNFFQKV